MDVKKELDSLGLAGVILNIIITGAQSIGAVGLFIGGVIIIFGDSMGFLYMLMGAIFGTLSVITLIYNAKLLSGELQYKKLAGILGLICLSVLGSVLLLISKFAYVKKELEMTNTNLVETLNKLKNLLESKLITDDEFSALKMKLINSYFIK